MNTDICLSSIWIKIPSLLRFLLILVPVLAILFTLLRVVFWLVFNDSTAPLNSTDLMQALWIGFRFDLRIILETLLPLFFLGWIKWFSPFNVQWARYFWVVYLGFAFTLISLVYSFDFGHYAYLVKRLDYTATRFLENPAISGQMVWESYPVIWISLALLLTISTFTFAVNRLFIWLSKSPTEHYLWWQNGLIGFVSLFIVAFGIYSNFSRYPLRWSQAVFSKHPFAAQLAYNPVHYFFDTWKDGGMTFDKDKTQQYYPLLADYLGVDKPNQETLNYQRHFNARSQVEHKPNVVIVILESFASYKSSLSGNPLHPSPNIERLAKEGYYFNNFFTPTTGTARSIFTTLTSMPDVDLQSTSSRNPLIVDQHSIANDFSGYEKFYFLGGSASWRNIRGMLNNNIDKLNLYEEGSYQSPVTDVWGISDIDLFREANAVLSQQSKPFFAIIQTSGYHRPYTIPDATYGFTLRTPKEDELKRYGFLSAKEYNSFRFMDHALGHFMDLAKKAGYTKNTIFAFWGDHGISGYAGEHVAAVESMSNLDLGSLRVPFIIWSPTYITQPKVFTKVASEVDVLATLAAISGQGYTASAIGRDLLDTKYDQQRYAFTLQYGQPAKIGLVGKRFYLRMHTDGEQLNLYDLSSDAPMTNRVEQYPEIATKMKNLTEGIYRTTQYMAYHNKRK
jgi:phosphoglycerol transferase MdoB-like AlkP superfamily enzyme